MEKVQVVEDYFSNTKYWRWGIFYFNKNDKRIFPPRRYGLFGCTINFLNTKSILINIGIVVLILLIAILLKSFLL